MTRTTAQRITWMSRSRPYDKSQDYPEEVPMDKRHYIGRTPTKIRLQLQSKYDKDVLSLPTVVAEIEDGDSHYNNFDLDNDKEKKS